MSLIYHVKDRLVIIHCDVSERLVTHMKWIFMWCVEQQESFFQFDDDDDEL